MDDLDPKGDELEETDEGDEEETSDDGATADEEPLL